MREKRLKLEKLVPFLRLKLIHFPDSFSALNHLSLLQKEYIFSSKQVKDLQNYIIFFISF